VGALESRMKNVTAGLARRFFSFCLDVFKEILIVSPSARNHTALNWGRPSGPTVARMAVAELRRSWWVGGIVIDVVTFPTPFVPQSFRIINSTKSNCIAWSKWERTKSPSLLLQKALHYVDHQPATCSS
jgi:hypothetical protein